MILPTVTTSPFADRRRYLLLLQCAGRTFVSGPCDGVRRSNVHRLDGSSRPWSDRPSVGRRASERGTAFESIGCEMALPLSIDQLVAHRAAVRLRVSPFLPFRRRLEGSPPCFASPTRRVSLDGAAVDHWCLRCSAMPSTDPCHEGQATTTPVDLSERLHSATRRQSIRRLGCNRPSATPFFQSHTCVCPFDRSNRIRSVAATSAERVDRREQTRARCGTDRQCSRRKQVNSP